MKRRYYTIPEVASKIEMPEERFKSLLHAMRFMYQGRYGSMWPYVSIPHSLSCEIKEVSIPATSRDGSEYMLRTTGITKKGIRLLQEQMAQFAKDLGQKSRIKIKGANDE